MKIVKKMYQFLIVFASLILVSLAFGDNNRVAGGSVAEEGQFPYIVSLRHHDRIHYCAGSIINKRWILTSGRCINEVYTITAVVGTNHLQSGGLQYPIEFMTSHEQFNGALYNYDIGLIKLATDIQFNNETQPIALGTTPVGDGKPAIFSGWGQTYSSHQNSEALLYLNDYVTVSERSCTAALYPQPVYDSQICAFEKSGHGVCNGDSGGPLVIDGKLHGIAGFVLPCGQGNPDTFTRITSYLSWINSTMENNK